MRNVLIWGHVEGSHIVEKDRLLVHLVNYQTYPDGKSLHLLRRVGPQR